MKSNYNKLVTVNSISVEKHRNAEVCVTQICCCTNRLIYIQHRPLFPNIFTF